MLAENNRAPFDFAEGESELVSGYNVEYGGGGFAFLFLAEYSNILFLSIITRVIFFVAGNRVFFCLETLIIAIIVIFRRGCFPRLRYDKLIFLC